MVDSKYPDVDLITRWYQSGEPKFDSSDNVYLDLITTIQQGQGKTGAYGVDWSTVSLPATPSATKWCIRVNTDNDNQMRLYSYNDEEGEWQFIVYRGAIGVTTVETDITAGLGTGTAIDYGSSAPRTKHTMQLVVKANTGDIVDVEVEFQGSLDGIEFFPIFSLFAEDVFSGTDTVINIIEMPLVQVRREITLWDIVGDAAIDIIITGV